MMKKYLVSLIGVLVLAAAASVAGCAGETPQGAASSDQSVLEDGIYTVDVDTGSSMFHINETKDGKGELTVKNGQMTLHITLVSKNIVNLFVGPAEDAKAEGAVLIEPTLDEVTYSDGITDEVYGFDLPCPGLDEPFDVSIIGTHGKWYTHPVTVTNPVKAG